MSKLWKPAILAALAITLFSAMYVAQPSHSKMTATSRAAAGISLDEIMSHHAVLPATEIDAQAYQ
jgi:hypothetical protein